MKERGLLISASYADIHCSFVITYADFHIYLMCSCVCGLCQIMLKCAVLCCRDQAPRIAEYGGRGEYFEYEVELRTMADVGLVSMSGFS